MKTDGRRERFSLLVATLAVLVWSGIEPNERGTWFLEVSPVLAGVVLLWITYARFPLTSLLYRLLFVHAVILMIGGGAAESFLGTQGDVWDTQWDMFLALLGAIAAQLSLVGLHDRALAQVTSR